MACIPKPTDRMFPYVVMIVVFPAVYYFTSPEFYYRRPIDPFLVVLAVYAASECIMSKIQPQRDYYL